MNVQVLLHSLEHAHDGLLDWRNLHAERRVSTSLLESSSLFERPAARIFVCSSSV